MSRPISQAPTTVCGVTENCLVDAYLGQLLSTDRRFRVVKWEQWKRLPAARRRDTVFVIDQCSTHAPIGERLKKLRYECPDTKFLVLDYEKSNDEILRLLAAGAHGYLPQEKAQATLTQAILCVAGDQLWAPAEVVRQFYCEVGRILRKEVGQRQIPTAREEEILELVRGRLSNREIADMLRIRVSTVKFHVSNIFSKLHATSRRELADVPFRKVH